MTRLSPALVAMCLLGCAPADKEPTDTVGPDAVDDGATIDQISLDSVATDTADASADVGPDGAEGPELSLDEAGLSMSEAEVTLALAPRALVDGSWVDGAGCQLSDGPLLRCEIGTHGYVTVKVLTDSVVQLGFEASGSVTLSGIALHGTATVPGARGWLSNGFQSWSQSGVIALGPPPNAQALHDALMETGDDEVIRTGRELSWWFSYAGGGSANLVVGSLTAERFRPWVQFAEGQGATLSVVVTDGGAGEEIELSAGDTVAGERWWFGAGDDLHGLLDTYGRAIESRRSALPRPADAGWNSWYELWDKVDEEAVRANAALAQTILTPLTDVPLRVVVDDGWQVRWGEWTPNDKFPSGLDGLATDLKADGFEMGVWLAPLLVDAKSDLVDQHPDWFVEGVDWIHMMHGTMRILDVSRPAAADHLREVISTIVGWGYDFLKIDFLFAGTFEGGRAEALTGMQAYHRALSIIRQGAGEDTILLAVGAPAQPSFPHVDAWRLGGDIAVEPFDVSWPFVVNEARSVAARWPLCHATLCDADPPLLRSLPRNEVDAGLWVVAMSGGAFFLSDDLSALPDERHAWIEDDWLVELAISGSPAWPVDVFPAALPDELASAPADHLAGQTTQMVPVEWRTPDGGRVAINTGDEEAVIDGQIVPARTARVLSPPTRP